MRKFLFSVSLAVLLLAGLSVRAPVSLAQGNQQTQTSSKTITGTVSSIGNGGTSFTLNANGSSDKQTMQFVIDKNTKVQGNVKVGTQVTVEYEAKETGPNLALSVTPQV